MATQRPFDGKQSPKTNAHGVTAPVQPRKISASKRADTQTRLKRVTEKHREAFSLLAKR